MNIDTAGAIQPGVAGGQRPQAGDIAGRMAEGLESGRIDADAFAERLEQRFGDDAAAAFNEDGSVSVEGLTGLLESAGPPVRPDGVGGFGGGPAVGVRKDWLRRKSYRPVWLQLLATKPPPE